MTGNQIGMKLGQIRKEKGISQSALAKITNIHRNTIIRMDIGAGGKLELMEAIARALEVRLSDVMRAVEENPIEDVRLCRASRKFYMEHMGISRRVAKRLKTAELIQLAHCKDDSARRLLLGVSSTIRPKGRRKA